MDFVYNDGGRRAAGFKGETRDCVCRAIAIATKRPYLEIYQALNELSKAERIGIRKRKTSSSRNGVYAVTCRKFMASIGWLWTPTMMIGQGCKVHLCQDELPNGRLVVQVSKHSTAVIDGVIHDTHNPARDGRRCVYGYFHRSQIAKIKS